MFSARKHGNFGTVGQTRFSTRKVIDNAYGGCKIARQEITPERIVTAQEFLFLILSEIANEGIPLWAVEHEILPIYLARQSVPCPVGTVDVLNLNLRRINRLTGDATASTGDASLAFDSDFDTACEQTLPNGWIQLEFESATRVPMFGILPGTTDTWSYVMQGSDDGSAWETFYTATEEDVVDLEWIWFDVQGMKEWSFIRILATDDTTLDVVEMVLANTPNEINMAPLSRDDYSTLPDKTLLSQPTQYWLDRQRVQPIINLWPAPNQQSRFWNLTAYVHRQIQDVGTMVQEIEVRQGWYFAIVRRLAYELALQEKEVKPDVLIETEKAYTKAWKKAWDGESDRAPTTLTPNIGVYTA